MNALLTCLLFAASALSQTLIESSSFGQNDRISPNGYGIPGWHVSGVEQVPRLLSNKVVLTPPDPGNVRGALWSESTVEQSEWTAELEFRASGPDRGGGNLQVWYTKNGKESVGTSSLYTAENFDGMVLVLDQYGGKASRPHRLWGRHKLTFAPGRKHKGIYERWRSRIQESLLR